jgi:hypothetical protein
MTRQRDLFPPPRRAPTPPPPRERAFNPPPFDFNADPDPRSFPVPGATVPPELWIEFIDGPRKQP